MESIIITIVGIKTHTVPCALQCARSKLWTVVQILQLYRIDYTLVFLVQFLLFFVPLETRINTLRDVNKL